MPVKFTDQYRRQVVAAYDQARRDGASVVEATARCGGHSPGIIAQWRSMLADADADGDDGPRHEAKRRQCLRCRRAFRSTWAGERICGACKGSEGYGSLPDSWGATATVSVADRD